MIDSLKTFYNDAEKAVVVFDAFVEKYNLMRRALADHICYKCESSEEFESIRKLLSLKAYMYTKQLFQEGELHTSN